MNCSILFTELPILQRPAAARGLVSWPGRSAEFRDNLDVAVSIGEQLGCRAFNALYGNRVPDTTPERQDELAVENLTLAGAAAGRIGGLVLVEPVSGAPAYPLLTAADSVGVIERVERSAAATNLRFLCDWKNSRSAPSSTCRMCTSW